MEVAVRLFFMEFRVQGLVDLLFVLAAGVVEAVDSAREKNEILIKLKQ